MDEHFMAHERSAGYSEHQHAGHNDYNSHFGPQKFASQIDNEMSEDPINQLALIPEPEASSFDPMVDQVSSEGFLERDAPSEAWAVKTSEKFHFQPNSMLAFYPRNVR